MHKRKSVSEMKGGAKHRQGTVYRGKFIDWGDEGNVNRVRVKIRKNGKEKMVTLMEKTFHPEYYSTHPSQVFRNPLEQIRRVRELKRINKEKNLGLRIVPTIRMRKKKDGDYSLLVTKLKIENRSNLNVKEKFEYKRDENRQVASAKTAGYDLHTDCFFPIRQRGKVVAMIADFGGIAYKKK